MSIREQRAEIVPDDAAVERDAASAEDAALRKLDVAEGRERYLREQVELLEQRLLDAEQEITALHREIRVRAQVGAEMQRTLSWRVTKPLRAIRRLLPRP